VFRAGSRIGVRWGSINGSRAGSDHLTGHSRPLMSAKEVVYLAVVNTRSHAWDS
jgi:hypothetical protein